MKIQALSYRIHQDGHIDHWLAAGPAVVAVAGRPDEDVPDVDAQRRLQPDYLAHFKRPVEWKIPLMVGGQAYPWRYVRCGADHALDLSDWTARPQWQRLWLYAEIRQARRGPVRICIKTAGTISLWLDRQCIEPSSQPDTGAAGTYRFECTVRQGRVHLFICHEQLYFGLSESRIAVTWLDPEADTPRITLPTTVNPERRLGLEELIDAAYVAQRVCGPQEPIIVRWPSWLDNRQAILGLNLQRFRGPAYMEVMHMQAHAGASYEMQTGLNLAAGHYQVRIRPWLAEYYEENQRVAKVIDVHLAGAEFMQTPEWMPVQRRQACLHMMARHPESLYSVLAQMMVQPGDVDRERLRSVMYAAERGAADAEMAVLCLILMAQGLRRQPLHMAEDLLAALDTCLVHWQPSGLPQTIGQAFLVSVCKLLVGWGRPETRFGQFGHRTGVEIRQDEGLSVRRQILWWMARGWGGCDSESALDRMLLACACLQAVCDGDELSDLATLLMDKILFTLTLNSWRGVYGAASTEADTQSLLDARLGALAAVAFLGWGLGMPQVQTATGLAMMQAGYEVPGVIRDLGLFVPEELWSRERHAVQTGLAGTAQMAEMQRWTYRTPDFMLSSLQDCQPGVAGHREHVWQATLGVSARVHVNHPGHTSEHEAVPRNFWRGNAILPRVAQWQELLIAIHRSGAGTGLGYTHAHFPVHAFCEHAIHAQWAFARKEDGYLALFAANGLEWITHGPGAYREVRSYGQENVWICCLGRRSWDGTFESFQARVQASVSVQALDVTCTSRSGACIQYGWARDLCVDGTVTSQRGDLHYDSPFCQTSFPASSMVIGGVDERALDLSFA